MECRISSSLTEFFKVYGIVCFIMLFAVFGWQYFYSPAGEFSFILLAIFVINIIFAIDFWRMKKVEMTDAGLIVTDRFFFKQTSVFIPYEKIKQVKNNLWWLGNRARTVIELTETTELGNKIHFIAKGFTRWSQAETVEELNRVRIRSRSAERLSAAFPEKDWYSN